MKVRKRKYDLAHSITRLETTRYLKRIRNGLRKILLNSTYGKICAPWGLWYGN